MEPMFAMTLAEPEPTPVTSPELLTLNMAALLVDHATEELAIGAEDPSE